MKLFKKILSISVITMLSVVAINAQTSDEILQQIKQSQVINSEKVDAAFAAMEAVKKTGAYIESIDELVSNGAVPLPVGIKKGEFLLVIRKLTYDSNTDKTNILASCAFTLKEGGEKVAFEGSSAIEGKNGLGTNGSLELISPVDVRFGEEMALVFNKGTKCEYGCDGIDMFRANMDLIITSKKIISVKPDGSPTNMAVRSSFNGEFSDFENFTVSFGFDNAFKFQGLDDVIFYLNGATIDQSDTETSPIVKFPDEYFTGDIDQEKKLWKGVYISSASIALPAIFKKPTDTPTPSVPKEMNNRFILALDNVLIDENGFTGNAYGEAILDSNLLDRTKWDISLNKFELSLLKNEVSGLGFDGALNAPPLGDNSMLHYEATLNFATQEYEFKIGIQGEYEFDVLKSKLSLNENSYVEVLFKDTEIYPKINASGVLTVDAPMIGGGDSKFTVPDITFENMCLSRADPYFSIGAIGLTGDITAPKLGGFELSISDINSFNENENTGLSFDVDVKVSEMFKGGAGIKLYGDYSTWQFDQVKLSKINVEYTSSYFSVKGGVAFIDGDPVYGKGFRGDVGFGIINKFDLDAVALFGKVDGYRYFLTDVFLELDPYSGLYVPPALSFYGFGGGMYQRMNQSYNPNINSEMGKSLSGVNYVPDKSVSMGFMVSTKFGLLPATSTLNSTVTFEMAFTDSWGLKYAQFRGDVAVMTSPDEQANMSDLVSSSHSSPEPLTRNNLAKLESRMPKNKNSSMLSGAINIEYDAINSVFACDLVSYLDVSGLITGVGPNNRLGWASAYFSPSEWYAHLGTPDKRMGVKILGFAQLDGYFMIGDNIPGLPPPPKMVTDHLNPSFVANLMKQRDNSALATGKGVAFGIGFRTDFSATCGPFYGGFNAGIGGEFLLVNFGKGAYCLGSSGTLGLDGWYASAQVWAYINAEIGMEAKIFRKTERFQILDIGAGAILTGSGPNPIYFAGAVGGGFSAMGGLVSGHCDFDFSIGDYCYIGGGNPFGIPIIEQLTPSTGEKDINVFSVPQVVLNMPVNLPLKVDEINGGIGIYAVRMKECYLQYKETGVRIEVSHEILNNGRLITIDPFEPFESQKEIEFVATVGFYRQVNGKWVIQTDQDGSQSTETKKVTFKSGDRPDHFMEEHVKYCYPIDRQFNYYPKEYDKGYIHVTENYEYLFTTDKPEGYKQVIRLTDTYGKEQVTEFSYTKNSQKNDIQLEVDFSTANTKFNNDEIYKLELVNVPIKRDTDLARNISTKTEKYSGEADMTITKDQAQGSVELLEDKQIYTINFRSSKYNTLAEKIDAINIDGHGTRVYIMAFIHDINTNITNNEFFDKNEVSWKNERDGLIEIIADVNNTDWFNIMYKNMYQIAPSTSAKTKRDSYDSEFNSYGYAPAKSIFIRGMDSDKELTDSEVETGVCSYPSKYGVIQYRLPHYCAMDLKYIKEDIALKKWNRKKLTNNEEKILLCNYPVKVTKGKYPVSINYKLPGINRYTSKIKVDLVNPSN